MKITKRQLKQMINEEKRKLIEMDDRRALSSLYSAIDDLIRAYGNEGALVELSGIVEDWEDGFGTLGELD